MLAEKRQPSLGIMPSRSSHSMHEELAYVKGHHCSFILGITFPKEKHLLILLGYQRSGLMQELLEI